MHDHTQVNMDVPPRWRASFSCGISKKGIFGRDFEATRRALMCAAEDEGASAKITEMSSAAAQAAARLACDSDESVRGRPATPPDVRASTAKSSPPVAGRHETLGHERTPSATAGRGATKFQGTARCYWDRSPQHGSKTKQNLYGTSGVQFADVDREERRLWDRVGQKMKQWRASQERDETMIPNREFVLQQKQQQQQDVLAGDASLSPPAGKVSEWQHAKSLSKSPSKAPAGVGARERCRAAEVFSGRQDASRQRQSVSSLSRHGSLSQRGSHSSASPIPIGEHANEHDILQLTFETHKQEVAVLRETIEVLQKQIQTTRGSHTDREGGRQGKDTPSHPARAMRACFGATPDNKERSPDSNHKTIAPDIHVLEEIVKTLKEDRHAQDSELLDALARVKSANISVLCEEQQESMPGMRRKDVVGQCCRTMQMLAASVLELLDEKDSLKAELHSLELSRTGDLLKVETELDILRDNYRKQQKALEDLDQAKELQHTKLLQAAEKNLAIESQVKELEASQSDMRQVTKSMERQHIDDCVTAKKMLEELERHRTANRELYAVLVNARTAPSTNGIERLLLHPPNALSPLLPSFLLDDRGDSLPPILGLDVSPPRAARNASPPRIRGLTPPRFSEISLPKHHAAAAGFLWDVESLPPLPHWRPPRIEIALPSSALRERNAEKLKSRPVGHGASIQLLQLPEPRDSASQPNGHEKNLIPRQVSFPAPPSRTLQHCDNTMQSACQRMDAAAMEAAAAAAMHGVKIGGHAEIYMEQDDIVRDIRKGESANSSTQDNPDVRIYDKPNPDRRHYDLMPHTHAYSPNSSRPPPQSAPPKSMHSMPAPGSRAWTEGMNMATADLATRVARAQKLLKELGVAQRKIGESTPVDGGLVSATAAAWELEGDRNNSGVDILTHSLDFDEDEVPMAERELDCTASFRSECGDVSRNGIE